MTSPDPAAILAQINAAREQTYQNIALAQGILDQANQSAAAAAQDRAAIQAIAQQTVSVDTSVGTRVMAGDTMIYGDTGWRDVTSSVGFEWVADRVLVRRVGSEVHMIGYGLWGGEHATTMEIGWSGFRPANYTATEVRANYGTGPQHGAAAVGVETYQGTARYLRTRPGGGVPESEKLSFTLSWLTDQSWPTSLPGTPA